MISNKIITVVLFTVQRRKTLEKLIMKSIFDIVDTVLI
jgi:hypothetical protein